MSDPRDRDDEAPAAKLALAAGARFEGLVLLHGVARIDGAVRGEVVGAERLEIGETAALEANVEAEEILVSGRVEGAVRATRRLELGPNARVRGRIDSPRLEAAEGARVDGECRVGRAPAAESESAPGR